MNTADEFASSPIHFLNCDDVLRLQQALIERFGGESGLRDYGLLESAVAQPPMQAFGKLLHPTIYDQAAAYLFHLVANHPFVDGNKRIGLHSCLVFLRINNIEINIDQDAWFDFVMSLASGNEDKGSCTAFIKAHTK